MMMIEFADDIVIWSDTIMWFEGLVRSIKARNWCECLAGGGREEGRNGD